jgi:uncharacterized short protein YbdD (DUF466 family)
MTTKPEVAQSAREVLTTLLRRIIGAPDYAAYRRHVAVCHPGTEPLTEPEFLEERLQARYSQPGNRCC